MNHGRPVFSARVIAAAILLFLVSSSAHAQTWLTWDGSPPGTPPDVVLDPSSDENATTFTITVHGFYIEEILEGTVTYHRVIVPDTLGLPFDPPSLPGLAGLHEEGKPELPYDAELVGVVTEASAVTVDAVMPAFFQITEFNGNLIRVWPRQPPTRDCDPFSADPPFTIQQSFYDTFSNFFPDAHVEIGSVEPWTTLKVARVQVNLTQYRPIDKTLRVMEEVTVTLHHAGSILTGPRAPDTLDLSISDEMDKMFDLAINFDKIKNRFNRLLQIDYLIIHDFGNNDINPLVAQKTQQGRGVTVLKVIDVGPPGPGQIFRTAGAIRTAIRDFYNGRRGIAIPYVLLVGDEDRIPSMQYTEITDPAFVSTTDKQYADINGKCDGGANNKLPCNLPAHCPGVGGTCKGLCEGGGAKNGTPCAVDADCGWGICLGDRIPDLMIARISVDTAAQLTDIVRKIVRYEGSPAQGNWPKNVLLAAGFYSPARPDNKYLVNQCENLKAVTASVPNPVTTWAPGRAIPAGRCTAPAATVGRLCHANGDCDNPAGAGNGVCTSPAGACTAPVANARRLCNNNGDCDNPAGALNGVCGPDPVAACPAAGFGNNNFVETSLNEGLGLLGYRGHGLTRSWQTWSRGQESWDVPRVQGLRNGCMNPAVFAICCLNGTFEQRLCLQPAAKLGERCSVNVNCDNPAGAGNGVCGPKCTAPAASVGNACNFDADCDNPAGAGNGVCAHVDGIGEEWLQTGNRKGAVAHYGATQATLTEANHTLNKALFGNIYSKKISYFGLVYSRAEAQIRKDHPRRRKPAPAVGDDAYGMDTAMEYEPMGDPDMRIRTAAVPAPSGSITVSAEGLFTPGGSDYDGDGVTECEDCNDDNAAVYPGAPEICDGLDNNCDDVVDNAVPTDAVVGVHWDSGTSIKWTPYIPPCPFGYNLYRLTAVIMPDSDDDGVADTYGEGVPPSQCGLTSPEATEMDNPQLGSTHYYQVTVKGSPFEGPMGNASNGMPRPNDFPCP